MPESEMTPFRNPDIHIAPDDIGADDELLLLGENPDTEHAGDAAHWMNIYRELVAYQETLLARNGSDGHNGPDRMALRLSLDEAGRGTRLERYQGRLDYWYDRHWRLRGLAIDNQTMMATHRGRKLHLTRREFQLLSFFLSYPDQTFTASVLAQRAWGDRQLSNDQVRIYVARLRARLTDLDLPCRLVSHPRRGYSFACD